MKMINRIFIATLAAAIATPAVVVPLQAEAVVKNPFKDVSKKSPYYDIIHEMRDQNIISGYENGEFRPSEVISRKHAAALVSRAKSLPVTKPFVQFKDVSTKNAFFNDVKKLQQADIFEADAKGNFYPNQPITRAEMAKVLTVAFDLEVKLEIDFPDVPKNHAANKYVRALYSNGITTGDNGYFKPNDPITRAHYAVFLQRLMNMDKDYEMMPTPNPTPKPEEPKTDGQSRNDAEESLPNEKTEKLPGAFKRFDESHIYVASMANEMMSMLTQKISYYEGTRDLDKEFVSGLYANQMAKENIAYMESFIPKLPLDGPRPGSLSDILNKWKVGNFDNLVDDYWVLTVLSGGWVSDNEQESFPLFIRSEEREKEFVLRYFGQEGLKRHNEQ